MTFWIQGPSFWLFFWPHNFYKLPFWCSSSLKEMGHFCLPISRWFSSSWNYVRAFSMTFNMCPLFKDLGLLINVKKSQLCLTQKISFIEAILDAMEGRVFLPNERFLETSDNYRYASSSVYPESSFFFPGSYGSNGNSNLCHTLCLSQNGNSTALVGSKLQTKYGQCARIF